MVLVELESNLIASAVGTFVVKEGLLINGCKDSLHRLERVESKQEDGSRIIQSLGIGQFHFSYRREKFTFLRQHVGYPLSTRGGSDKDTTIHETVKVEGPSYKKIRALCNHAVELLENDVEDKFQTLTWNPCGEFWSRKSFSRMRNFSTVNIDANVFENFKNDIDEFTSDETKAWYNKHCIPYRR